MENTILFFIDMEKKGSKIVCIKYTYTTEIFDVTRKIQNLSIEET